MTFQFYLRYQVGRPLINTGPAILPDSPAIDELRSLLWAWHDHVIETVQRARGENNS